MGTLVRTWTILSLIGLSRAGESSVDILTSSSSGLAAFEEEDILHVLSRNKTDTTENFTFVELISSLGNYSIDAETEIRSEDSPEAYHTNPHYGESTLRYHVRISGSGSYGRVYFVNEIFATFTSGGFLCLQLSRDLNTRASVMQARLALCNYILGWRTKHFA